MKPNSFERRLLIAAGGTGGHLFPAQALVGGLKRRSDTLSFLFAGGGLRKNAFFQKEQPFREVACGRLTDPRPWKFLPDTYKTLRGVAESLYLLRSYRPHLVVGFGSYHTLPILLAASLLRIPFILHEANAVPGKVVRLFAKRALVVGAQFPSALPLIGAKGRLIALPLREEYRRAAVAKGEACNAFGLREGRPLLLVFGGSQGAERLNRLAAAALSELSLRTPIQVIHLTGSAAAYEEVAASYRAANIAAYVAPFERRMALAFRAADLAIMRAGGSSIAELCATATPAILVPYPGSADGHQEKNADFVANEMGGAVKLLEGELTGNRLAATIEALLHGERLREMGRAIAAYRARPIQELEECILEALEGE